MQSSLWKLAVITGVVALCLLVIDHAREDMANTPNSHEEDVAGNGDTKSDDSSEGESDKDFSGNPQPPAAPHDKTGDAVSHVGHINDDSEGYPHLAQTGAAVPVENPFGDHGAVEPRPLGDEGLPLSGQDEPAAGTTVDVEGTVPELWNDPTEAELVVDTDVTEQIEEIPSFDGAEVDSSIGIFDAAAAASTEEAAAAEVTIEEEIIEIVPEELPASSDDFLVDESTEPLAMPAEDETETAITEIDPFETSLVAEPTVEVEPAVDTELYDFASEETDPFADDVNLPTAGDEDAPLDEVQLDATGIEDATQELLPLADDFADDNAVEAIEPFEPGELTQPEETETADAYPESPELTELPLDDAVEEIVVEEPANDFVLEVTETPAIIEPEQMSADDFSEGLLAGDEPAVAVEEPFETRELAAEDVVNETPPLPSFPETDVLEPEVMLTDETEPVATESIESEEVPVAAPDAEPTLVPEVEETFTETLEEPAEEPVEDLTTELIAEPEPELLPAKPVPARAPKVEVPSTDTDAVESQPAADEDMLNEDMLNEDMLNEDVIGEGTIDADSPRGEQRPQLTIDKQSPPTAVLGKPFIYSILIKNVGQSPAGRVTVEDEIPRGAKLTGTIPQAELVGKKLIWKFGTLQPNQERKISIRVIPIAEGPIGSVATVNFVAEVAAQTVVQKPDLKVSINAPKEAPLGKPVVFQFKVTNLGTMVAKKVVLRDILPSHFTHPGGKDLEYEIGDLAGGQTRDVQLTLTAAEIGAGVNQAIVTADGDISIKAEAEVKILDQGISINRVGPKSRLLRRATSFTNSIRNKAKSPINDLVVVEQIPEGMKFLKASQGGNFDPQKKTVTWNIQQIAGEESEDVSVMLLPEAPGTKESVIRVFGETGQIGSTTAETAIRGFALLDIKISQADQPVVIGERVSYRIEIQNRGTEAATGVLVSTLLPEEMKMVSIKGPLEHQQTEQQIDFSPIADLAPNKHIAVDILLEAQAPGDTRLHVQVQSDQMKKPLSREAATVIFGEQN